MLNINIDLKDLVDFLSTYGLTGALIIILILIIYDPDRAEKLKALFLRPFFVAFKWGTKSYIASEVAASANMFISKNISKNLPSAPKVKIKVDWVDSPNDPILLKDGSLILRLQDTNDQTRNILAATRIALPQILFPTLRTSIQTFFHTAVDLTILKKLSEQLGKHARPVFHRYFLSPEIEEDKQASEIFAQLVELDASGIFVPVFLEELDAFGESLYQTGDLKDKTEEIISFLKFLMDLATRQLHQHISLDYLSRYFKVGIILLAQSYKAELEGTIPYVRRLDEKLRKGCESIYIVSYQSALDFLPRLIEAIKPDRRYSVAKRLSFKVKDKSDDRFMQTNEIVLLRKNSIFTEESFSQKISSLNIQVQSRIEGTVIDTSPEVSLIDIHGLRAILPRIECSWLESQDCRDFVENGKRYEFLVKNIDSSREQITLSFRFPENDPWQLEENIPQIGQIFKAEITESRGNKCFGFITPAFAIVIPNSEISWFSNNIESSKLVGSSQNVKIIDKNDSERLLVGSIRQCDTDPWPVFATQYPKGMRLVGTVIEINPNFIRISLPDGLTGTLSSIEVNSLGLKFDQYIKTISLRQKIDVVIKKLFVEKQKIRLTLPK